MCVSDDTSTTDQYLTPRLKIVLNTTFLIQRMLGFEGGEGKYSLGITHCELVFMLSVLPKLLEFGY